LSGQGASVAVIFIAFVSFVFVQVKTLHSKHVRTGDVFVIYGMGDNVGVLKTSQGAAGVDREKAFLFLFLCLHEVGAHYTYAEVPSDRWTGWLFGREWNDLVGWERKHFNRVVDFLYGALIT
jgi:hypothetical protein